MSDSKPSRVWDPYKVYGVSAKEKLAVAERAQMRSALKSEWQKKVSNPYRAFTGVEFDPAVQRYDSMKVTFAERFRATPRTALSGIAIYVAPIALMYYLFSKEKAENEAMYRTGQVASKDREWKFV